MAQQKADNPFPANGLTPLRVSLNVIISMHMYIHTCGVSIDSRYAYKYYLCKLYISRVKNMLTSFCLSKTSLGFCKDPKVV